VLRAATLILAFATLLVACGAQSSPEESAAEPAPAVVSSALGLRLGELPEGVRPVPGEGDRIVLEAVSDGVPANLEITVGPPEPRGINLVAEAKGFGDGIAREGGKFFGANQIVTPWGSGFAARVLVASGQTEEIRVFLLHPAESDRLLVLSLAYPPGGPLVSRARMSQTLETIAAIEPLGGTPPAP